MCLFLGYAKNVITTTPKQGLITTESETRWCENRMYN